MAHRYVDLRQHIDQLRAEGLLFQVDRPIDKDSEMQPLVRWQFRGGIPEEERRAFLFTQPTDAKGTTYANSVLVGGLAASPLVYAMGLQTTVEEIPDRWKAAYDQMIEPVLVDDGPVHEVVLGPEDIAGAGGGFASLPVPISTPGFDNAPYLTSAHCITKHPETGVRNVGHYRGQIKSQTTCAVQFSATYKHGYVHWKSARDRGEVLPMAWVVGAPPVVSYAAVQPIPYGDDEYALAGGLAGEPIELVKCKTIDLEVPADAEIVLEGYVSTDYLEPEGPFGESHGHVHTRTQSPVFHLTAITHRRDYVWTSFISQVTPSESSVIKKVGYEPMIKDFLSNTLGIPGVKRVVMHEALTNLRKVLFVQFAFGAKRIQVWRALKGMAAYRADIGKVVIAVDEDIDPDNLDAVLWAIAYRSRPHLDTQILRGHMPSRPPFWGHDSDAREDSNLMIDATLKFDMPPVSLPKREYMERAREIWDELGLPELTPQSPWHGYVVTPSEWGEEFEEEARLAVAGDYFETGAKLALRRDTEEEP